jgi:hypothetical protein
MDPATGDSEGFSDVGFEAAAVGGAVVAEAAGAGVAFTGVAGAATEAAWTGSEAEVT